jgi:hypothetical protein
MALFIVDPSQRSRACTPTISDGRCHDQVDWSHGQAGRWSLERRPSRGLNEQVVRRQPVQPIGRAALQRTEASMRTRVTIMAIVVAVATTGAGALMLVGLTSGSWIALAAVAVVLVAYQVVLRGRLARWGATDAEVRRSCPATSCSGGCPARQAPSRSAPRRSGSGRGWCRWASGVRAGTATTGSTTTAAEAPTGSFQSSSAWRSATASSWLLTWDRPCGRWSRTVHALRRRARHLVPQAVSD